MKYLMIRLIAVFLFFSCQNEKGVKNWSDTSSLTTFIAKRNKANTLDFFRALEAENAEQVAALFSNDAKHINPYHSGIFPKGANSKEGIKSYWEPVFPNFDGMTFHIKEIYSMGDGNRVFVKYKGYINLKDNAGVYSNDYYSTFKFNDEGKITEYVEIFNPIVAAKGFGLLDKVK